MASIADLLKDEIALIDVAIGDLHELTKTTGLHPDKFVNIANRLEIVKGNLLTIAIEFSPAPTDEAGEKIEAEANPVPDDIPPSQPPAPDVDDVIGEPSAADLDAVAAEQKATDDTSGDPSAPAEGADVSEGNDAQAPVEVGEQSQ